ncbi:hypothetical protein [uncultured Parolsenella sp.]|uniref:hypothetical protein n=1 Tax=uncultured Parolsenella sp. TaxID=2083008 RepID=UPI0025F62606|nr:hypothetical protein [uncultured Parolsenella sp.]
MANKPEPLFIEGHYHFTLSSYDPVQVTITVPHVSEREVEAELSGALRSRGHAGEDAPSDEWVAEHFEGIESLSALRDAIRSEQERMNQAYSEFSKASLCATELAKRLEQSVPAQLVQMASDSLIQGYQQYTQQQGLPLEAVLSGMGMNPEDFQAMLANQAIELAAQEAALDAFADEYAIVADESELPGVLEVSPTMAKQIIEDARAHNALDDLLRVAVRTKVRNILAAEAEVTYEHESAEDAEKRVEQMLAERANWTFPEDDGCCCGCCGGEHGHGEGECCGGHDHGEGDCCCGHDHGEGGCCCGGHGDDCCDHGEGDNRPHLKLV